MTERTSGGTSDARTLKFVGPKTAAVLDTAPFGADAIREKRVSFRMLVDAGVHPGVAAKIRREHSLAWSFSSGADLERRSAQIRGLSKDEAAWVAASSGGWADQADSANDRPDVTESNVQTAEPAETDGSGDAFEAEAAWRTRSRPTPLETLDAIDTAAETLLGEAGITSVRSLATADPDRVADVLALDRSTVRKWHELARDTYEND
ncbi:DUF7409 domain-containing protein [Halalkalirubrum salinum]|uniref:DUF7409 domain-containing protein n=1 Tax=Halalkalirubrum salinum TaxID=2563889 RepID=UPI0010FB8F15|nr:hypothetical protein [Halalkalirubrum salinum]